MVRIPVRSDFSVQRTEAKRNEQLTTRLDAELDEITVSLDPANAMKVRLYSGSTVEVVIPCLAAGGRGSSPGRLLRPSRAQVALLLIRNIHTFDTRISYLLSVLTSGSTREPDSDRLVLCAIEEIEGNRQAIFADARLLGE